MKKNKLKAPPLFSASVKVSSYRYAGHQVDGRDNNELYAPSECYHLLEQTKIYDIDIKKHDVSIYSGPAIYVENVFYPKDPSWNKCYEYSDVYLTVREI